MYGLVERARLLRHEKTFKRAVAYAVQSRRDAEQLALSTCGAVCWLAGVAPGRAVEVRSALSGLNPSRWNATCAELRRAAQDASSKGNAAHHLAFALLAGVIDSRIIEIRRPSVASLAAAFRDRAVAFAEDLTSTALRLIAPDPDGEPREPATVSVPHAEQRREAEAGTGV